MLADFDVEQLFFGCLIATSMLQGLGRKEKFAFIEQTYIQAYIFRPVTYNNIHILNVVSTVDYTKKCEEKGTLLNANNGKSQQFKPPYCNY